MKCPYKIAKQYVYHDSQIKEIKQVYVSERFQKYNFVNFKKRSHKIVNKLSLSLLFFKIYPIGILLAFPETIMNTNPQNQWIKVGTVSDFPADGGACVKIGNEQIAVFHFNLKNEWYACQNLCPHKKDMVLARGIIGDHAGEPKVACPQHKKTFSLKTGKNLGGEDYCVTLYPVKIENDNVYLLISV